LDEDEPLVYMHTVHRAKIVWTVVFDGVIGEANLVIKYNTTFADAVAGAFPKNGEFSLRIRREVAGPESERRMAKALTVVANACQVFRDDGWDEKTAAWTPNPDPSPSPSPVPDGDEEEDEEGQPGQGAELPSGAIAAEL